MQSVYEVCTEKCSDELFKIEYPEAIENAISIVEKSVRKILKSSFFTNYRWISLKLLEGNTKIISSIENYLNINLVDNENISCSVNKTKEILEGNIEIKPTYNKGKKEEACKYCEYKSICCFNPNVNNYSFIDNKSKKELLDNLQ